MGAKWTDATQDEFLEGYFERYIELKHNIAARDALFLRILEKFVERWGPDTWGFNNVAQFKKDVAEEVILAAKKKKMLERVGRWYYNREATKATRKPDNFLLSFPSKGKLDSGRARMAKPLDKYYALYIQTNSERKAKLDELYKAYVASLPQGQTAQSKVNWRIPILTEWYAGESEELRKNVEVERHKEMGLAIDGSPLLIEDTVSPGNVDQVTQKTAEELAEEKRLKKAQIQQDAASRIPSALYALSEKLTNEAMAKGIILLGLPVPSRKGKVTIFKMCVGETHDTNRNLEAFMGEKLFNSRIMNSIASYLVKAFPEGIEEELSLFTATDDTTANDVQPSEPRPSTDIRMDVVQCETANNSVSAISAKSTDIPMDVVQCEAANNSVSAISAKSTDIPMDVVQCEAANNSVSAISAKKTKKSRRAARREKESGSSSDEGDGHFELPSSDGPSIDEASNNNSNNSASSAPGRRRGTGIRKTPYELEREARLKENDETLKSLGLDQESMKAYFPTRTNKDRSHLQDGEAPSGPIRRSARISSSGNACQATAINDPDDNLSDSLQVIPASPVRTTIALPTTILPPIDLTHDESAVSPSANGEPEIEKDQSRTDAGHDERSVGLPQSAAVLNEGKTNPSSNIRQAGVEIMVPLGVRSTEYEQFLEERQRMLEEPNAASSGSLSLFPPSGLDGDLFPVFDLQDIKSPELRSQADWIPDAEILLCDTFKSSGTFAKLAVRYWLKIEEKLGYPGFNDGFPAKGRPAALAEWMKNRRKYSLTPKSITSFAAIEREFLTWWVSLQPMARRVQGIDPKSSDETLASLLIKSAKVEAGGWSHLSVGGKNGLFLVFLMLVWLKRCAETRQEQSIVDVAVEDVCWTLDKVLEDLKARECADGGSKVVSMEVEAVSSSKQLGKGKKRQRQSASEPNTRRTRTRV